jgi:hypothetical protein
MTKSRAYEFEHEVRAVTVIRPLDEHGASDYDKSDHPVGINVAVDLATLLEVVDISPKRPAYFRAVVRADGPGVGSQHGRTIRGHR